MIKICSVFECDSMVEGNTEMCARHNREARNKSAPKTAAKKTRIKPVSDKQADRNEVYNGIRELYLSMHPICQTHYTITGLRLIERATTVHHKKGRDNNRLFDVRYFLPCCLSCHQAIENQPELAKKFGFSLSRLSVTN